MRRTHVIRGATANEHSGVAPYLRWPHFRAGAADTGVRSLLCIHLFTQGDTLASLNLFSDQPDAFDAATRDAGLIFASHAAIDLAAAYEQSQLAEALVTRQRIGEAVGILAKRHQLSTHEAFNLLARTSQNHNVKLRELANRLVTSEDDARPSDQPDSAD